MKICTDLHVQFDCHFYFKKNVKVHLFFSNNKQRYMSKPVPQIWNIFFFKVYENFIKIKN